MKGETCSNICDRASLALRYLFTSAIIDIIRSYITDRFMIPSAIIPSDKPVSLLLKLIFDAKLYLSAVSAFSTHHCHGSKRSLKAC